VRRNTTRKDAQKSTKVMENGVQHCICLAYSRYPVSSRNALAILSFLFPVRIIVRYRKEAFALPILWASAVDEAERKTKESTVITPS
jgi:hypothetical protein